MKIFVGMIAYNEEYMIEAAIKSIYNFVFKIVVVDGSPTGPSTDKTAEIVNSIEANSDIKKIKYISGTYPNKEQQRNVYLEHMVKDSENWLFTVDADEIWKKEDLLAIKTVMQSISGAVTAIHFKHIHFWRDFHHIITGGIWDRNILYRINRLIPRCYYRVHNTLSGGEGHSLDGRYARMKEVFCYHGGHAQTWGKEYYKYLYMCRRGDYGINDENTCQKFATAFANGWLKGGQEGMKEFEGVYPTKLAEIVDKDGILKTVKNSGAVKGKDYP